MFYCCSSRPDASSDGAPLISNNDLTARTAPGRRMWGDAPVGPGRRQAISNTGSEHPEQLSALPIWALLGQTGEQWQPLLPCPRNLPAVLDRQ